MCFENSLLILLNDAEGNIEKRKQKMPVDSQSGLKDALMVEFKGDGSDKTKVVMAESRFNQLGLQATMIWKLTPGLVITQGAESLGKDRIWPVVITLGGEPKK